jgi:hypothetical protein
MEFISGVHPVKKPVGVIYFTDSFLLYTFGSIQQQ